MPVPVRHSADQAFAPRRTAAGRRHGCRGPGFVEEDEATRVEPGLSFGPGPSGFDYVLAILLLGPEMLF